jgi:hypothetical protein
MVAISPSLLPPPGGTGDYPPLVRELLFRPAKNDGKQETRFFAILKELATKQKLDPADLITSRVPKNQVGLVGRGKFPSGRAVVLKSGKRRYVLVILEMKAVTGPGAEAQQLILLGEDGKVLDKVECIMTARSGSLLTTAVDEPWEDKAQIVIRHIPFSDNTRHGWHVIVHDKRAYTFRPDPVPNDAPRKSTVWFQKGLCRLAIQDGKFVSVFPKLEKPDFD